MPVNPSVFERFSFLLRIEGVCNEVRRFRWKGIKELGHFAINTDKGHIICKPLSISSQTEGQKC